MPSKIRILFHFGGMRYHGKPAVKTAAVQLNNAFGRKFMEEVVNKVEYQKGNSWRQALLIQKFLDATRSDWDLGRMDVFRERTGLSGKESRYQSELRNVGIHRPARKLAAPVPAKKKVVGIQWNNLVANRRVVRQAAQRLADGEIVAVPEPPRANRQPQEAPQVRIGIFR
jgi:hypothetical protein